MMGQKLQSDISEKDDHIKRLVLENEGLKNELDIID